jgi:hypothetical protein
MTFVTQDHVKCHYSPVVDWAKVEPDNEAPDNEGRLAQ